MNFDILSIMIILCDLLAVAFLVWRATARNATLDVNARIIYGWVILTVLYHAVVYCFILFSGNSNELIIRFLHPFVALYMLNAPLIAIIHWRGGRL